MNYKSQIIINNILKTVSAVFVFLIFNSLFLIPDVLAASGINKQISYQGVLKTGAGIKVSDGDYDIVFKIYNASTSGSTLWTGTHTTANGNPVTITDGVFSVLLGSGSGNIMTLDFNDDTYYLGVKVGSDSEMTPRKRIGASGYAFNTDTLDGIDSLSFLRSDEPGTVASSSASAILTITQSGTGDILNLFDGATEVFTVLDGGNVGIGTTSPSATLNIYGNMLAESSYGTIMNIATTSEFTYNFGNGEYITLRVSQNADDAEERVSSGVTNTSSADLDLINNGTYDQEVGIRWQGINIPQGATISNAYIEFTTDAADSGTTTLYFWGEDSDNTSEFAASSYNISNRATTTVSVVWSNVPAWNVVDETHQTPNLSSIIQEIINRPGWSSGNALSIIITGSGVRTAESYNGNSTQAPLLYVQFTTDSQVADVSYTINNLGPGVFRINDSANDTSPFTIDKDGNIGIGTITPSRKLTLVDSGDTLSFSHDGSSALFESWGDFEFKDISLTNAVTTLVIEGSGGGAGALKIKDGSYSQTYAEFKQDGQTFSLDYGTGGTPTTLFNINKDSQDVDVQFEGISDEYLLFLDAGNNRLGIGTSTPSSVLHVIGDFIVTATTTLATTTLNNLLLVNQGATLASSTPLSTTNTLYNNGGILYWNNNQVTTGLTGNQGQTVVFDSFGNPVATSTLFISLDGNVGIGTTTPSEHLEVSGTGNQYIKVGSTDGNYPGIKIMRSDADDWRLRVASNDRLYFANSSDDGANWYSYLYFGGTSQSAPVFRTNLASADLEIGAGDDLIFTTYSSSWDERMRLTAAGDLGVGDTSPAYRLEIGGGDVNTTGGGYRDAGSCVAGTCASDIALKKNIQPLENSLERILELSPATFEFIDAQYGATTTNYGLVAQEVEPIFPEWVVDRDDGYKSIRYGLNISMHMLRAIQEQQEQIKALQVLAVGSNLQKNINDNLDVENLVVVDAVFEGNIVIKDHTAFGRDSAGQAKILAGHNLTTIVFTKEYGYQPIVTITPIGIHNINYGVEDITTKGFKVVMSPTSSDDIIFNWHAFGSDGGKIYVSDGTVQDINIIIKKLVEEPVIDEGFNEPIIQSDTSNTTTTELITTTTEPIIELIPEATTTDQITTTTESIIEYEELEVDEATTTEFVVEPFNVAQGEELTKESAGEELPTEKEAEFEPSILEE